MILNAPFIFVDFDVLRPDVHSVDCLLWKPDSSAVDFGKEYKYYTSKELKQSGLVLFIGLVSMLASAKHVSRY